MKLQGILNVTPDSFSDGGRFDRDELTLEHARELINDGADIIDVGAESTRPGHTPVSIEEEIRRLHLLKDIVALGTPVSVDTYKPEVLDYALSQGVTVVNDIWGFRDSQMARLAASGQFLSIIMHNQDGTDYPEDLILSMRKFFDKSLETALRAGLKEDRIVLDPGIGFGKSAEQNWEVLGRLREVVDFGYPVLLGTSRKGFLGKLTGRTPDERLAATLTTGLLAALDGVEYLRVHDVKEHKDAMLVLERIKHE